MCQCEAAAEKPLLNNNKVQLLNSHQTQVQRSSILVESKFHKFIYKKLQRSGMLVFKRMVSISIRWNATLKVIEENTCPMDQCPTNYRQFELPQKR